MRTGKLTEQEIERLICAKDAVAKLNILIDDSSSVNAIDIRLRLMRVKHERGRLDGVVVDFLQRMRASKPTESRQTEVSRIAQDLKSLGVPVIAVSSLSRACEDRKRPRPRMSDLRDSGDIESEADVVGLLFRPHYYDPNADATLAELIIDKHRHGATGTINLRFMPEFATFCDYRR
jgi:replicative DNA helicase